MRAQKRATALLPPKSSELAVKLKVRGNVGHSFVLVRVQLVNAFKSQAHFNAKGT